MPVKKKKDFTQQITGRWNGTWKQVSMCNRTESESNLSVTWIQFYSRNLKLEFLVSFHFQKSSRFFRNGCFHLNSSSITEETRGSAINRIDVEGEDMLVVIHTRGKEGRKKT
jgi:hypothetical protein